MDACIHLITWFTALSVLCKGSIERAGRILYVCVNLSGKSSGCLHATVNGVCISGQLPRGTVLHFEINV